MQWLDEIYKLVAAKKVDAALDVAFENFDDLFRAGKFEQADIAIETIDLNKLDVNLLSGILACTFPAKHELKKRADLIGRVRTRLTELVPDRVDRIMKGL